MLHDELLDIVDTSDCIIGQELRSKVYEKKLSSFRVVNAFLINNQGKLWIPRRTQTKKLFPLCLDASMGGHVMAGETYEQALFRELQEELNIDLSVNSYSLKGYLTPQQHTTSAFMQVYVLHIDIAPAFNKNDFCEYYWLSPKEILDRIAAGEACKGDLPIMIKELFCGN